MSNNNFSGISGIPTKESHESYLNKHVDEHKQSYYTKLSQAQNEFNGKLGTYGVFSKEGAKQVLSQEAYYNKLCDIAASVFAGDEVKKTTALRMMKNYQNAELQKNTQFGLEGWGGSAAVHAAGEGALPASIMPFVIGGWIATSSSQEIYNIISQDGYRLNFSYNIDYLMYNDKKYYFPKQFRSGEIAGFNELPPIEWSLALQTWGTDTATWDANRPYTWIEQDGFIGINSETNSIISGNLLEAGKKSVKKNGVEPNSYFGMLKYQLVNITDPTTPVPGEIKTKRIDIRYDIATGAVNKRIYKQEIAISDTFDNAGTPEEVNTTFAFLCDMSLDTGDFTMACKMLSGGHPTHRIDIVGIKFNGRCSNIQNEDLVPTTGTEKYEFIREVTYKQYANVGLNEYMLDNFQLGNGTISYPAYAIDNLLEYTLFERELAAENHFIGEIESGKTLDQYELTNKMGGFIQPNLQFDIGKFTPGLNPQSYKDGLKTYLNRSIAISETYVHLPHNVKRDWIFLGYDGIVSEFPEIKFEDAVVNNNDNPVGGAANENFGFTVQSRCGYIDTFGRTVRIIGNADSRWLNRGSSVYGTVRTYSMEYPFFVYYPYAIRMMTTIDPNNNNRTAITVAGREFRGEFAMCAIKLNLNGILDAAGVPINNFENQINDSKQFNTQTPSHVVISNTADAPVYMEDVTTP